MSAEKLYYADPYTDRFTAQVLSCTAGKAGWEVVLDRTAFYPEGGGQPGDTGTLGGVAVTDTRERDGEILHICAGPLEPGQCAAGEIDWPRRFDYMQQHSGEHIVSGLIHERFGYENVGFHMGAAVTVIDFSGELAWEDVCAVERRANEILWENRPVEITWPTAEELRTIPYRSKKALTGAVRIVTVPGADVCACCGTHVAHTGEVGLIRILSCQKFREGSRLELLCGGRAYAYSAAVSEQNRQVSVCLSAKPLETAKAVNRVQRELEQAKYRLTGLENKMFAEKAAALQGAGNVLLFEEGLEPDAVRRLAAAVMERCGGRCAVFSGTEESGYQYALGETGGDLGSLVKEMNRVLNGRGGGKPFFAQGSVGCSRREIEAFFAER